MLKGIDVSAYQGTIEWPKVKAAGFDFAYIKTTEGINYSSPTWRDQKAGARAVGILVGPYHFERPGRAALDQVGHFTQVSGYDWDLPPAWDCEVSTGQDTLPHQHDSRITAGLEALEDAWGVVPILYTYPGFWFALGALGRAHKWEKYPLWIAHYLYMGRDKPLAGCQAPCHSATGKAKPTVPPPWEKYTMWQVHGDDGRVPGVNGKCDINVFDGAMEDLVKLYEKKHA